MPVQLLRSLLYVPADNPRRVEKALNSGADAAILDLEDAVAISKKPEARANLRELLSGPRPTLAYVRVNSMATEFCLDDIEAAIAAGADGISLPKVENARDLFAIDWLMSQLERRFGVDVDKVDLLPVVESGLGVINAPESLKGVRRVKRAGLGVGDLALELNLILSPDQNEARPYRAQLVVASNAAGLDAPLDTVYLDLNNLDGLRASCIESCRIGFQGRRIIHPSQVEIVNEVYSPSPEEIARAERIINEFTEAEKGGLASMRVGEVFVDYPIAEKARKILAKRDAIERRRAAKNG
ncbi:HpcH/HpaI aldolase/citrate lyase family protein [Paraburkholderia caledonica]|uniref:HpcH/HpaI aldolase/citrate lyase family protein n=1 Tax=Paraburkholderia caledonica TaxID=134536 RepID=UPI0003A00E94|nr:CoA ester lyase [Paraburkholderia caledonica]